MALLTDISKRVQDLFSPQLKSPLPQRKQIQVKKNFVSQFANSPVGQAISGTQKFIESNQKFKPVPTFTPFSQKTLIGSIGNTALNLPGDIANTIVGQGVVDPALDIGRLAGARLGGRDIPTYNSLKSAPVRLAYNIMGEKRTPQQIIGNTAESLLPPLYAYGGGKVFGIGRNTALNAGKKTFAQAVKHGAAQGSLLGSTFGVLGGLAEGRNSTFEDQFSKATQGGVIGAGTGLVLGGGISAGGQIFGKIRNAFIKSGVPEKEANKATTQYITKRFTRDPRGRFASNNETPMVGGGTFEKRQPTTIKYWNQVDKELGIPKDFSVRDQTGKIDFSAKVGGQSVAQQPISDIGKTPIFQGQSKNAYGTFDPNTKKIKVGNLMDNATIIHELAHKKYEALPQELQGTLDYSLNKLADNNYGIFTRTTNPTEDIAYAAEEYLKMKNKFGSKFTNEFNKIEGGKQLVKFFKEINNEAANQIKKIPSPQQQTTLSKIKSTLKDQRGFLRIGAEVGPQGKSTKPSSPEIIPQGKKVRGFPQTVIDTKGVPKEIKDFAKTQTYDPLGNKEVLKTVSKIVKQGDAQAISFAKNNETVEGNATAMVMMRKLIDQNRIDEANDLIAAVSPRFTKQGQEIQILSQFSRLKPEGAIRWAQSFIDKANKANPRLKLQLKPSQTKMIIERAKKVQSLPEGSRERIVATAELIRDIKEVVPPSWGQRIATIQTMSQLLNPKTLIRNVGGNTIFGGIENVSQTVGAGIDKGVSLFTGKRAVVKPSFSAQTKGFAKGLKEGTQDALKSIDTSGGVDTKFDLPTRTFTGKYNPLTYLEKAMNIALRAPDRASYQAAYNASIDNQLRASGTTKITPQMIETAHADGLYRTFQDNSRLAQVFTGTKKLLNKVGTPDGKFGVGDLILKYPKTPANLLARGLDYSPVGFAKGLYQGVRPLLTGKPFEQKAFVEALSRGLTGTGLISAGYILANNGILTGKPTKDYDLQAAQRELGTGPFRLNVDALKRFFLTAQKQKDQAGDNIISFDWAQPISLPFAMGANLKENPTSQDAFTSLVEQLDAGASTLTQQSLVQGVTNFAKDTGQYGPVRAFSNAALGAPSGFIPTFSNQIVQLGDNISKETYDPSALKQSFNRVISRIPFAQDSLPNKVGVLGQDQQRYQNNSNNFINVFLNPAFVSKISENPTAKEVLDIFNRSGETQQAPRVVDKKIKINGYMQSLTPTELGEYQRYVGVRADNMIRELMNDPNYQNMSDEGKATLIGNNLSNINSAAKIELFGNNPKKVDRGVKNVIGGAYQNKEDVNTTTYDTQSGFGAKAEASDGMYSYIDKNGDYQTIDISEPIGYPKLTGSKAADKELISTYKSKISSRVNDIRTLYEDGKITEEEFVSLIDELQTQLDKNSTGKGRRGTKLKLPTPKALPVLKFSKRPLYKAPKLGTKIPKAPRFSVKKPNTKAVFAKPSKERLTIRTVRA